MKYAFVFGSSAFIVPHAFISYSDSYTKKEFLKIGSIYHDIANSPDGSFLSIDLHVKDTNGSEIILVGNQNVANINYTIQTSRDSVHVLRLDGSTVIHVHQLDDESAMALEHNIVAELEVHAPIAVIRITGEFMVEGLHIRAENEKLLINDIGYATAALPGKGDLKFTVNGVVM